MNFESFCFYILYISETKKKQTKTEHNSNPFNVTVPVFQERYGLGPIPHQMSTRPGNLKMFGKVVFICLSHPKIRTLLQSPLQSSDIVITESITLETLPHYN